MFLARTFCLLLIIVASAPVFVAAETRALLIGVSDYDNSFGITDLKGPANDVKLMSDVLAARGVNDITVLAGEIGQAHAPTRQAILSAFASLADESAAGDFVYIHLSGHGTRQKDLEGDETDGLDEVFLPADTARSEPGTGIIPNALIDDEIGEAVRQIRQKGADVWLVMDSCNSGSGLRAASPGVAARYVDPATLGVSIPVSRVQETQILDTNVTEPDGGLLAFYAARSNELAHELEFGESETGGRWYGLFTAKLAARLEAGQPLSYRQLFQAVLSDINDGEGPQALPLQTPLWEGNLVDSIVFGGAETIGLRRFKVDGDQISAGLVHGLGNGTLVGLVADATAKPDEIIGFAQLEDVEATKAFLRPVAQSCIPSVSALCPLDGVLPEAARFAQVQARPVSATITFAPPRDLTTGIQLVETDSAFIALKDAIDAANEDGSQQMRLELSGYDIETVWANGKLWFGISAAIGATPIGASWEQGQGELAPLLTRIAKAEELGHLLGLAGGETSLLNPSPVEIKAQVTPVRATDLAQIGTEVSPIRECRRAQSAVDSNSAEILPNNAELKQCDRLEFVAQGVVQGARDVNRVHIDAQFCINVAHERIEGSSAPRQLGPSMTICSDCPGGYSAGEERLFVIVTEAEEHSEALNLEGLLENCQGPGATRGATIAATEARKFLTTVARRPDTRGSMGGISISNIWVENFAWRVLPRIEAFARAGLETE